MVAIFDGRHFCIENQMVASYIKGLHQVAVSYTTAASQPF
jgi:hypothetical protein